LWLIHKGIINKQDKKYDALKEKTVFYSHAFQRGYEAYLQKYAGYKNWRLPTLEEATSLIELKKIIVRYILILFLTKN
jgi:hypothetical protein